MISKIFKKTKTLTKYSDFQEIYDKDSICISGSDQVFRPKLSNNLDKFLLNYTGLNNKKIAISASFGVNKEEYLKEVDENTLDNIKIALQSFDYISVRENAGQEICKDLFDINADYIIDPVFMLNKKNYAKLIDNAETIEIQKEYIASYTFDKNEQNIKADNFISNKYNLPIIELDKSGASIENWLKTVQNCKFLLTNSYHGMCFAIIFNKPFICTINGTAGSSRIDTIMKELGLNIKILNSIEDIYTNYEPEYIDYDVVNQKITQLAKEGVDKIKSALEMPVGKLEEKKDSKIQFLERLIIKTENEASLSNLLKIELWNLWLKIFYNIPPFIRVIIQYLRGAK